MTSKIPFLPVIAYMLWASNSWAVSPTKNHITDSQYIAGGVIGTITGFGIGHAIQGRWRSHGWIYTAGELGSLSLMLGSGSTCMGKHMERHSSHSSRCPNANRALMYTGMVAFLGFRIWETIDLWVDPPKHNEKLEALKGRPSKISFQVLPYINSDAAPAIGAFASF